MGPYVLEHTQLCSFSHSSAADKTESFYKDPERVQTEAEELGASVARAEKTQVQSFTL